MIPDIQEVQARFEQWRQGRQKKGPYSGRRLWTAAGWHWARRDGINRTAAALHLDGGKLKRAR